MPRYKVIYNGRKQGAIGIFYDIPITVEADNEEAAKEVAFIQLQDGYQTSHPVSVELDEE